MAVSRVIEVSFGRSSVALVRIDTAYFYNNGILFKPTDIDLPASYQVHWADSPQASTTLETIGTAEGAQIPDDLWNRSRVIYGWIYLHPTEDSGVTGYEVRIYKNVRAGLPDGTEPTPAEQSTIDQLISALNTAVAKTAQDVISADQSARSASGDADRAERARTGAEIAQGKAEEAQESAERAKDDAETSERNASESERKAKGYAENASEKADAITGLTAQATTLPDGSSATASYDAETGVMSFGIPKGKDGTDGDDGYSPTANVSKTGKTATITITDKNGTTTAQVEDGTDGIDGISPSVSVTDITGGHRVVITDKDGAKSFDVEDGATGATPNLTIGTVETLEPTDDATATITGTAENPVLNFGIPKGEQGEVTLEEFYKAFPTDTASGAIASFSDGADDLPLKSLVVDINPVQDLHGYDSPWPAGGGEQLIPYPYSQTGTTTINGITFDVIADGDIAISGTASANAQIDLCTNNYNTMLKLPAGDYTISVNNTNVRAIVVIYDGDGHSTAEYGTPTSRVFNIPNDGSDYRCRVLLRVLNSTAISGTAHIAIKLQNGSLATAWSPYENICPISGWTEVDVEQSGKNIYDINGWLDKLSVPYTESNGYVSFTPTSPCYSSFFELPSGTKTLSFEFSGESTATNIRFRVKYANGTIDANATAKKTGDIVGVALNWSSVGTIKVKAQIELGSTATPYSPCTGHSITIDLGQTVYGGKLDVLSGELVIDRAMVDLESLTWNAGFGGFFSSSIRNDVKVPVSLGTPTAICSMFPWSTSANECFYIHNATNYTGWVIVRTTSYSDAAAFKTAMSGVQLCYELATPITVQLSANQINSLYGVNNLWADSGDTEVVYRADTKLFIERLTAPDSADMIADSNITSGQYFMVGNSLYKATANIANGSAIIVGTNAVRKSLSEALNEINA